jgi:serine-type D-Ala-D-Ala carboxypeptidase (penicillin-binding protein 5/6)
MRPTRAPWRRTAPLVAVLLALGGGTGFGPPQFLASDGSSLGLAPAQVRSLQAYKTPVVSARAAAVLDGATGAVLYSKNGDLRFAPASLTKMMTALVAVERGQLAQRITASERVRVEPVVIGLDPGETLTLEQLLFGLLLWSGNDAAVAIAEGVGGSIPRYADWMNEKAAALGLRHTHFVNPHGLDTPGHYSSAEDMARLLAALMRQPVLARITGSREYTIEGPPLYKFRNSNPLLGVYDGVNGGKTGLTDECGRCLAVTARRGGHEVVAVVLGSDNIARDARVLLDYAFGSYDWVPVAGGARGAFEYRLGAESVAARLAPDAAVALPGWETGRLRTRAVIEPSAGDGPGAIGRLVVESALRGLGDLPLLSGGR